MKRIGGRGERQHERERRIVESENAIAFVPARGAIILGVDQQRDAADIIGDADASIGREQQERAAGAPALYGSIDAEATEPEHRHVVTAEAFFRERRRPRTSERGGLSV